MVGTLLLATALTRHALSITKITEIPTTVGETSPRVDAGRISGTGYVILNVWPSSNDESDAHQEIWNQEKGPTVVAPPHAGGGVWGINAKGVAVGDSADDPTVTVFVWSPNFQVTVPDVGPGAAAYDVNDQGVIVGAYNAPNKSDRLALKIDGGQVSSLQPLKGFQLSAALRVNGGGEVAGYSQGAGEPVATVWDKTGTPFMVPLLPNARGSRPTGINDKGETIGVCLPGAGFFYGAKGTVPISYPGGPCRPEDINNAGQVVGEIYFVTNEPTTSLFAIPNSAAFIYSDGRTQNLNDLLPPDSGWSLKKASGINGKGQVVGEGVYHDHLRAYLLQLG